MDEVDRGSGEAGLGNEMDAAAQVARDDVAGGGGRSADQVVGRGRVDADAVGGVADGHAAGPVGADEIALGHVAGCSGGEPDAAAVTIVEGGAEAVAAGDQIAGSSRGPADRVVGPHELDPDDMAIRPGVESAAAGRVRADEVSLHEVR